MSKFNLKNFKKASGDDHIDRKLQEEHEVAPNEITENQLKDRRVDDQKEVILEKLLESKRSGAAEVIIEKNLNDSKGLFAPLRNSKTSSGDINKVEEKRLAGEKAEKEKYKPASKTPKAEKWWEHLASNSTNLVKTAINRDIVKDRMDKFTPEKGFGLANEMGVGDEANEGLVPDKVPNEFVGSLQENEDETEGDEKTSQLSNIEANMEVVKRKVTNTPKDLVDSIYFQFKFDPRAFGGDEDEIKQAAYDKAVELQPTLADKISPDSFLKPNYSGINSTIQIRLVGHEYFKSGDEDNKELFTDFNVDEIDVGGTPTIMGQVKLSDEGITMATESREEFTNLLKEYILEQDPELDEKSIGNILDFSNLENGEVKFATGGAAEESSNDFSVNDLTETEATPTEEDNFAVNDLTDAETTPEDITKASTKTRVISAFDFQKGKEDRKEKKN